MRRPNIVVLCQAHSSSTIVTAMYTKMGWLFENPEDFKNRYEHFRLTIIKKAFKINGYDDEVKKMMDHHDLGSQAMRNCFQRIRRDRGGEAMRKLFRRFLKGLNQPWIMKDPSFSFQCMPYFQDIFDEFGLNPMLVHLHKDLKLVMNSHDREGHPKSQDEFIRYEKYIQKCYDYWKGPKRRICIDDIKDSIRAKDKEGFLKAMAIWDIEVSDDQVESAWEMFDLNRDNPGHPLQGTGKY